MCNIGPLVTINPNGIITECDASFYNQKIFYNYGNVVKDSIEEELLKRGEIVRPSIWYRKTGQMIKKHNTYNK